MTYYRSNDHNDAYDRDTRERADSFSGRFSNTNASNNGASRMTMTSHPAALQTGSAIYLPPSTQLRADVLQNSNTGSGNYYGGADGNPFRDETATITPFDSISNVGDREDDTPPAAVYGSQDYLARDPYARNQQVSSYNTRARSGSIGEGHNPRDSNGDLPLMQHAVMPAAASGGRNGGPSRSRTPSYYDDSIIDGDTIVDSKQGRKANLQYSYSNRPISRDEVESYPPPPRYDGPDEEEKGDFAGPSNRNRTRSRSNDNVLSTLIGNDESGKRPNAFLRQFRDTTPLKEKIKNHKAGIGIQQRPWACWVIAVVLVIVFIVELAKSVSLTRFYRLE